MAFSDFMDNVKTRSQEVHITLAITSGKKSLHMGMLASTITMRQNADGYIYFDTMPEEIFTLNDYSWEGPRYKNVTTTQEKGKHKDKTGRKGGLGAAAVGTLLMPGVGTAIGYAMGSKKVTKGKHKNNVVTDENQEEIDGTASIQLRNAKTGETFSFGFVCNTKINVDSMHLTGIIFLSLKNNPLRMFNPNQIRLSY